MSKLVVFDVDGTILDSFGIMDRVIMDYSEKNNLPVPDLQAIRRGYAKPMDYDFKWGVPREEQKRVLNGAFQMLDRLSVEDKLRHTPELFDGVGRMLEHLKDLGHTLAIVTSKPEAPLMHVLEHHNIYSMFSAHRTWDDIVRRQEREKPFPDMLQSVMRDLNFSEADTVMIGDTTMDIHMGRAADTLTVGVTWGAHPVEYLTQAGAHRIVDTHVQDIVPAVQVFFK
jgi:phosphoglycolate phosphatase